MSDSPEKKKKKLAASTSNESISVKSKKKDCKEKDTEPKPTTSSSNFLKRANDCEGSPSKRIKKEVTEETMDSKEKLHALRRNNFVIACQDLCRDAYFDNQTRFHLNYQSSCLRLPKCAHRDPRNKLATMSTHAEESFKIELKTNMWWEALDVCLLSITPTHYLSAEVMKDVVEIMLNAHDDPDSTYTITDILIKCRQILTQNYNTHPPCMVKKVRSCYKSFLTSHMDLKDNTFTNRSEFGCDKGIVKYCLNRLEHEMGPESTDEPLVDQIQNVPDDMKQSVRGLHWQKQKFEIYEVLERDERMSRLFMVLESTVELLKADLALWHHRHPINQSKQIMRSGRPLMASVLWTDNVLFTGAINETCRQIMRIFVKIVQMDYLESDVMVVTTLLNTAVQTFYLCESTSNKDYPHVGKYCNIFADELFKIISELPKNSIPKVIEAIQPSIIKHAVAIKYLKVLLSTEENYVMDIMASFLQSQLWNEYPESLTNLEIKDTTLRKPKNITNFMKTLTKTFTKLMKKKHRQEERTEQYPKETTTKKTKIDQNHVVHALYITLEAYVEAYSLEEFQKKLAQLNKIAEAQENSEETMELHLYSTSTEHIKLYRTFFKKMTTIVKEIRKLKDDGDFPDVMNVFKKMTILK